MDEIEEAQEDLKIAKELTDKEIAMHKKWEERFAAQVARSDKMLADLDEMGRDFKRFEKEFADIARQGELKQRQGELLMKRLDDLEARSNAFNPKSPTYEEDKRKADIELQSIVNELERLENESKGTTAS